MALTKIQFYLASITLVILIFIGIGNVGTDLSNNSRITLNEDSVDYVLEVKGV